jgi:hypothetical protein
MKFALIAAAAIFGLSSGVAQADFDLRLRCTVTKGALGNPFVPDDFVVEFDLKNDRARLSDEIFTELGVRWHYLESLSHRGRAVRFGYGIFPSNGRYNRKHGERFRKEVRYAYSVDPAILIG